MSGIDSIALGSYSTASGYRSTAMGSGATASADRAIAIGTNCTNDQASAFAVGFSPYWPYTPKVDFRVSSGKTNVYGVLKLEPQATAPASPAEGDMYMDSTTHKLKVYDGTTWQSCW